MCNVHQWWFINVHWFRLLPSSQLRKRARGEEQTKNGNRSLFTPQSLLNKARQGDLGRSAGSFPLVLFPPRERRTEEVCPARRRSVESFCCLGRELYDLFPYCIESIKKEVSAMASYCLTQYWPGTSPDFHRPLVWPPGVTLLLRKRSRANFSYLLSASSFRRVLFPVHWAVSLPSTCLLLLPPAKRAERSLSLLFSLREPLPLL